MARSPVSGEFEAVSVKRPDGQLPVCGQCLRWVKPAGDSPVPYDDLWAMSESARTRLLRGEWRHVADGTPRCPQGLAEAWRRFIRMVRWS